MSTPTEKALAEKIEKLEKFNKKYTYIASEDYAMPIDNYVKPIDSKDLKFPIQNKITVKVGDLVRWKTSGAKELAKQIGLVTETHFVLVDWDTNGTTRDQSSWRYVPSACIMWNNGETTDTTMNNLILVSES